MMKVVKSVGHMGIRRIAAVTKAIAGSLKFKEGSRDGTK